MNLPSKDGAAKDQPDTAPQPETTHTVLYKRISPNQFQTWWCLRDPEGGVLVTTDPDDDGAIIGRASSLAEAFVKFAELVELDSQDEITSTVELDDVPVRPGFDNRGMSAEWEVTFNGRYFDLRWHLCSTELWSISADYGTVSATLFSTYLDIEATDYELVTWQIDPPSTDEGLHDLACETFDENEKWPSDTGNDPTLAVSSDWITPKDGCLSAARWGEYQRLTLNKITIVEGYNWDEVFP